MCAEPRGGPAPAEALKRAVEIGFPVGRRIKYGLFTDTVEPASIPDEAERRRLREQAAADMAVIGADERQRRSAVGYAGGAATVAAAAWLLASHASPVARAALIAPIWLFLGYIDSGRTGL